MKTKENILYTKNLSKSFEGEQVLKKCTIEIDKGEMCGILGPNGAGKTTLLKLLAGFLRPTMGNAYIDGLEVEENKEKIQKKIGSLIETPIFYEDLSGRKNLEVHLKYMGIKSDVKEALQMVGLDYNSNKLVSKYSLGMRQRLAIARSFIHSPKILILDEPVNGLDPIGLLEMRELFIELTKRGITILISSHMLNEIRNIATTIIVISKGIVVMKDTMANIVAGHKDDFEKYLVDKMKREVV